MIPMPLSFSMPNPVRGWSARCVELRDAEVVQLDDLGDRSGSIVAEIGIGDALDLPSDASKFAISALVVLSIETSTVPRHVIDLDSPLHVWKCTIGVHDRSVAQNDRMLTHEHGETGAFERSQESVLET